MRQPHHTKTFVILILSVLLLRLILLPFTNMTTDGDSVVRILITWKWIENPEWITHGGWVPLPFYLIALALWIWPDPMISPSVLHTLLSVFTAIPLWGFARREWGEPGALFVSAAYLFYPLSMRLGFLAPSEIPFVFFVACGLYFVSAARGESKAIHAIFAGLSMTFAAASRIEGWVIIPLFGIALWGQWKLLLLYLFVASTFPISWMIGNVQHGLSPIAHLTVIRQWQLEMEGINEGLNFMEVLRRLYFFPAVVFFGLTPPISVLCLTGMAFAWKDPTKRVWMLPFILLLPVFMVRTAQGLGTTQTRFGLVLGLLLIPFAAVTINRIKERRWTRALAILCIAAMFPFSYSRIVFDRLAGPSFPNPFPPEMNAIPKVRSVTREIARLTNLHAHPEAGGLVIDFFRGDFYPYQETYHVVFMSRVHPDRLFVMPGARHERLDVKAFVMLLERYPSGILLYSDFSKHMKLQNNRVTIREGSFQRSLRVEPITKIKSISLFRYTLEQGEEED